MCVECLREAFPERQRCTLERGSYMLNFAGCKKCGTRNDFLVEQKRTRNEDEDESEGTFEETIEFEHCCKQCGHMVAKHVYEFRVVMNGTVQEFSMSCALCGKGEDTSSSLPKEKTKIEDKVKDDLADRLGKLDASGSKATIPFNLSMKMPAATSITASATKSTNDVVDDEWE